MYLLNYLYFLIITLLGISFLFQARKRVRHPLNKKKHLWFEGPEMFWVLTFATGILAFSAPGTLDLMAIRLLVLEILCLLGVFITRQHPVWTFPMIVYVVYLLWLTIGLTYSPAPAYGFRVILKYIYPFLVMLFASAVVRHKEVFLKAGIGARTMALVCIFIAFVPFVGLLFPGVFWYGTALAINFITMCIFSIALYFHGGRDRKDLIMAIIFTIPCIVWVFRTSIMGTTLALMVFFFFRYKMKSLPIIFGVMVLFVSAVFFIPSIKEKMFNKDSSKNISMISEGQISQDDIDSNGRFAMWEVLTKRFYDRHETIGSGTGSVQNYMYNNKMLFGGLMVPHNDYVQIICDNGVIGVVLYLLLCLSVIIHSFWVYNRQRSTYILKICAITAGSSLAGVMLTMYTDNVVNYSMATLSFPFGFYGMMLGLLEGQKRNIL